MTTAELVAKNAEEVIRLRRIIHQNPELSNEEFETTELIRRCLTEYGIEIAEIGMKTGVVGVLRGGKPGKTVALREDIDALRMPEETGLPFASRVEGKCHSCGHDLHTAVLLGCAKALAEIREELCGNVLFLFQPAEENGSGARQLEACRFWEVLQPDTYVGLHTAPDVPVGSIGVKYGVAGASCDKFTIRVTGEGGHGAHPESCVDPIVIASSIVLQLQTVVAREIHPVIPAVLTVGTIHGGTAKNIIADFAEIGGTLRNLDPECRKQTRQSMERIAKLTAEALRGSAELTWDGEGTPVQVNDDGVIDGIIAAAQKIIGDDHILRLKDSSLGSEDFSVLYPNHGPGAQFKLGTWDPAQPNSGLGIHSARNIFDERSLEVGVAIMVQYTRDYLK